MNWKMLLDLCQGGSRAQENPQFNYQLNLNKNQEPRKQVSKNTHFKSWLMKINPRDASSWVILRQLWSYNLSIVLLSSQLQGMASCEPGGLMASPWWS